VRKLGISSAGNLLGRKSFEPVLLVGRLLPVLLGALLPADDCGLCGVEFLELLTSGEGADSWPDADEDTIKPTSQINSFALPFVPPTRFAGFSAVHERLCIKSFSAVNPYPGENIDCKQIFIKYPPKNVRPQYSHCDKETLLYASAASLLASSKLIPPVLPPPFPFLRLAAPGLELIVKHFPI
jgi:hypothetical protein